MLSRHLSLISPYFILITHIVFEEKYYFYAEGWPCCPKTRSSLSNIPRVVLGQSQRDLSTNLNFNTFNSGGSIPKSRFIILIKISKNLDKYCNKKLVSNKVKCVSKKVLLTLQKNEYLFAMKEDLSEWLQILHSETINAYSFFRKLETGILLCKHANTGMVEILSNS